MVLESWRQWLTQYWSWIVDEMDITLSEPDGAAAGGYGRSLRATGAPEPSAVVVSSLAATVPRVRGTVKA